VASIAGGSLTLALLAAAALLPPSLSAAALPMATDDSPPAARATQVKVPDGRDARPPLDLREVHSTTGTSRLEFYVMTWSRWSTRPARDRAFVLTYLDTLPAPGFDYYVLVRSDGRRLRGNLYRVRVRGRDRRLARVAAWRNDRRSVSLRVPRSDVELAGARRPWAWQVQTLVTNRLCKRVCFDSAPDTAPAQEITSSTSTTPRPTGARTGG
jgi:hypothetical protein